MLQIFDGNVIYIIDPKKITSSEGFQLVCKSESIVKIFHSGKEDLEVLWNSWGCELIHFFDTQVAYSFLTSEPSIGYAKLVTSVCEVELDKQETQSDWLLRPLTAKQLDYAAKDVEFLLAIYEFLEPKISGQPFQNVLRKEFAEMVAQQIDSTIDENAYRHAKDVVKLNEEQLVLFKLLFDWREKVAFETDRTRNHIFRDQQLVEISIRRPKSKKQMQQIDGVHPRSIRLYLDAVVSIIEAFEIDNNTTLKPVANPRDINELKPLMNQLSKIVVETGKSLQLSAANILSKRQLKNIAYSVLTDEPLPKNMGAWRKEILWPLFIPVFAEFGLEILK